MLIPSDGAGWLGKVASLSRRVNANSQLHQVDTRRRAKLIKKGEC